MGDEEEEDEDAEKEEEEERVDRIYWIKREVERKRRVARAEALRRKEQVDKIDLMMKKRKEENILAQRRDDAT